MVRLTVYSGIKEIGGNKILLEEGEHSLFLDYGLPYARYKRYYEEYLKPRSGAGLIDFLTLGLLPPLQGIYRDDLENLDIWGNVCNLATRKIMGLEGILLTHAHLDHSGHISFIRPEVPVYSTALTAFIAKAIQDSGTAAFDQQVCYYTPVVPSCPPGWKQKALISSSDDKCQRRFHIPDEEMKKLDDMAIQFWLSGFWERTSRQKKIRSSSFDTHNKCHFELRCFPVDHSIPGACAWAVNTSSGWIVYSGDLRSHGKRGDLTRAFISRAEKLNPRAMIIEGTNIFRTANVSEDTVYENALRFISCAKGLVIADFSARDVDRLLTFLEIARRTGRKLAILAKDAYLLRTVRLLEPEIPDIALDDNLVIYQETTASKSPPLWLRNLFADYNDKVVLAEDVRKEQSAYIMCFSFFDINELPGIRPDPGGLYVYSSSEPHDEEQEIDFRRLRNWLDHFKFEYVGLPVEVGGEWQIPEGQEGLHASGHACGTDLLDMVKSIKPQILVPVHCQYPEFYCENLKDKGIQTILPEEGVPIEI